MDQLAGLETLKCFSEDLIDLVGAEIDRRLSPCLLVDRHRELLSLARIAI